MALIAAMGAAQLAIIASTSYQGGSAGAEAGVPAKIEVGKRTNKVDKKKLSNVLSTTSFEYLQKLEKENNFPEAIKTKDGNYATFFKYGKKNTTKMA